jgi:inosine-uridine nucleoside N-ribohydrolase
MAHEAIHHIRWSVTSYVFARSMLAVLTALILCYGASARGHELQRSAADRKTPVILDTDIGDDIDDTWALTLLLKSPELDLKLVVSDFGNTIYRAKIVARLLEIGHRSDVSVGIGIKTADSVGAQSPWVKDYDLSKYPGRVYQDGVQALVDTIMRSPERITVIAIGPTPNIKAALDREPRIVQHARFVGMHGSIRRGYGGKRSPEPEYNVKTDPEACRRALEAAWNVTITPLDTCSLVSLRGEKYAAVRDCQDPLIRALVENYRIWCGKNPERAQKASSTLFDTVAVYLAISEDLLVMEKLRLRVTDDGRTVEDPAGKQINCALDWKNLSAYEDFLVRRLTGK